MGNTKPVLRNQFWHDPKAWQRNRVKCSSLNDRKYSFFDFNICRLCDPCGKGLL